MSLFSAKQTAILVWHLYKGYYYHRYYHCYYFILLLLLLLSLLLLLLLASHFLNTLNIQWMFIVQLISFFFIFTLGCVHSRVHFALQIPYRMLTMTSSTSWWYLFKICLKNLNMAGWLIPVLACFPFPRTVR